MHRRGILGAVVSLGTMLAATRSTSAESADKRKVVYHLTDLDKVAFVLGNIRNHFDGAGGPERVTIALVVHGPALKAFHAASAGPDVAEHVAEIIKAGGELGACGHTMKAQKVGVKDLLPGFVAIEEGGVVRLAELQSKGYAYLRP